MLILDRSRTLDRMIWAASRHTVVVPEPFSSASAPAAVPLLPAAAAEAPWRWRESEPTLERGPRRLSAAVELRRAS